MNELVAAARAPPARSRLSQHRNDLGVRSRRSGDARSGAGSTKRRSQRELLLRPIGTTVYFMPPYTITRRRARAARRAHAGDRRIAVMTQLRCGALRVRCLLARCTIARRARRAPAACRAGARRRRGIPESRSRRSTCTRSARERPLVAHGAERALNPASTMKLVTTYAGARAARARVHVDHRDLRDRARCRTTCSPAISSSRATATRSSRSRISGCMLRNLRARGIREIRGDVVLDRTLLLRPTITIPRASTASRCGLTTPVPTRCSSTSRRSRVQFVPEPEQRSVRLIAEPALAAGAGRQQRDADRRRRAATGSRSSRSTRKAAPTPRGSSISGPYRARLRRAHAQLQPARPPRRTSRRSSRSSGASSAARSRAPCATAASRRARGSLVSTRSPALSEVVRDINKYSNNVMARQLFLTLGALGEGAPGTLDKARNVVRQWLAQKGIAGAGARRSTTARASRASSASARARMGELLLAAFRSPVDAGVHLVAADRRGRRHDAEAPLQRRRRGPGAHQERNAGGRARDRAATCSTRAGAASSVVFIVNHANAANAQAAQDALLRWVYRAAR